MIQEQATPTSEARTAGAQNTIVATKRCAADEERAMHQRNQQTSFERLQAFVDIQHGKDPIL